MCHFLGARWRFECLIGCCGSVLDLQCQVYNCGKLSLYYFTMFSTADHTISDIHVSGRSFWISYAVIWHFSNVF